MNTTTTRGCSTQIISLEKNSKLIFCCVISWIKKISLSFLLSHTHLSFFDYYSFLFPHSSQNFSPLHFMRLPQCVCIYIPNPSHVCFTYICMSLFSPNSIRNRKPRPCPYNWAYTVWAGLSCFIRTPQQSQLVTQVNCEKIMILCVSSIAQLKINM